MSAGFTCEGREVCPQSRGYFREVLCWHLWVMPLPGHLWQIWGLLQQTDLVPQLSACTSGPSGSLPPPLLAGSFLSCDQWTLVPSWSLGCL